MSESTTVHTKNRQQTASYSRSQLLPGALFAFTAALVGTAFGFIAALAVAMPMMHSALASETAGLQAKLASSVTPADSGCFQAAPSGAVLGAATQSAMPANQPIVGGQGAGSSTNTFIKKLIGGQLAETTAVIKDTGPQSSNKVVTTNTTVTKITNTNDINVSAANDQQAVSGTASVTDNTNAGSAATGQASNTNSTSLDISVNN